MTADAQRSPRTNEATAETSHRAGNERHDERTKLNRLGRPRLAPLTYGYGHGGALSGWCRARDRVHGWRDRMPVVTS